jgi:HK97 family phage major capsid protein
MKKLAIASAVCALGAMTRAERDVGRYLRGPDGHDGDGDGRRDLSPEQAAKEVKADFDKKFDELKSIATDALGKAEKGEPLAAGAKQTADEAITAVNEAKARLDEIEQKLARQREERSERPQSAGQMFVANEDVKAFLADQQPGKRIGAEVKAIITSLTTDADGSAGDLIVPMRAPMVDPVERRLTVRDLLTPGSTSSNAIQYPKETGFTNSAAAHSETSGATKPQSELKFDIVTESVKTIAHFVIAHRSILDDVPMLRSYIDGRLRYGLGYVEDNALLNGAGGADLNGIYTQATASTANLAIVTAPTFLDVLRAAMLQASLANIPPTGIVLNPTDWFKIETTKDTAGAYIIGNPQEATNRRLWGLPVVETPAMTVDKFLVGAFKYGAQIFDRMDARVEISTEDASNFRQNLVTILCEERLALAVYNTLAFVKGDFSDQVTDLTS